MNRFVNELDNKDTAWISVLKGVAIIGIVLYHWFQESDVAFINGIFRIGGQGIYIFFILSSFGISLSLMRQGQIKWLSWFKKRFFKILIPYYLSILLVCVFFIFWGTATGHLNKVLRDNGISFSSIVASIFFYRAFIREYVLIINAVWWFVIAILELYLLYPFLYAFFYSVKKSVFLSVTLLFTASYQIFYAWMFGSDNLIFSKLCFNFLFEFSLGIYFANLYVNDFVKFKSLLLGLKPFLIGVILQSVGAYFVLNGGIWGAINDLFVAIGFFIILINIFCYVRYPGMLRNFLCSVGEYSLGIFLLHLPFIPLFYHYSKSMFSNFLMLVLYILFLFILTLSFNRLLNSINIKILRK